MEKGGDLGLPGRGRRTTHRMEKSRKPAEQCHTPSFINSLLLQGRGGPALGRCTSCCCLGLSWAARDHVIRQAAGVSACRGEGDLTGDTIDTTRRAPTHRMKSHAPHRKVAITIIMIIVGGPRPFGGPRGHALSRTLTPAHFGCFFAFWQVQHIIISRLSPSVVSPLPDRADCPLSPSVVGLCATCVRGYLYPCASTSHHLVPARSSTPSVALVSAHACQPVLYIKLSSYGSSTIYPCPPDSDQLLSRLRMHIKVDLQW